MNSSETFIEYYITATDETSEFKLNEKKEKVKNI